MRARLIVLAVAAVLAGVVLHGQITVPFPTFTAGTTIDPDQMNSNFSTVSSQALNRTGGTVTGNIAVNTNVTIDGADISDYLNDATHNLTVSGTTTTINGVGYVWPASQGNNGTRLTNNGSGTLSWTWANGSTQSGTFTASDGIDFYIVTATATVNLPDCDGTRIGKWYHIKNTGAAATITLDGNGSQTIDGQATYPFSIQYASISIVCNGAGAWSIF
jgi:hypothetical protein